MMQQGGIVNENFRIPNNLVGLVIGRGGEQIKKLQAESQCKIRIASEGDGTPERSCTLTGSVESIDMAKHLLEDVIRRGQNREQGGGFQQRQNNYGGRGGHQGYGGHQQRYGGNQGGYEGNQQRYGNQQEGFGGFQQ